MAAKKKNANSVESGRVTVVGIGASAGGIEALCEFFAAIPPHLGLAYVVIVHLAPEHESELVSILGRRTRMGVVEVNDDKRLELKPNCVYVIAPDRKLELIDGMIGAAPFAEPRGRRAPIDGFFRSLADGHGDGFAVILSGGGTDGALGAKAVKEAGGVVLVQDPRDATHEGMPRAVIGAEVADVVLPVRELALRLAELVQSRAKLAPLMRGPSIDQSINEDDETALKRIFELVRSRTGHDFSRYKRATILRRLARRMQLNHRSGLEAYLTLLRESPEEIQSLFDDLLISVTTFFRDPAAWEALRNQVVVPLVEHAEANQPIRIWVPGCATGEEAYTLAILFREEISRRDLHCDLVIFGSDVDQGALATAREGVYQASIIADVSETRLARYFRAEGDHYRVAAEIRDSVVFAVHSVLRDPPFSKLHLISCRNLLIYLDRDLQQQLQNVFRYGLRDDGYLYLGVSETADGELFEALDKQHRIFRARVRAAGPPVRLPQLPAMPQVPTIVERVRERGFRLRRSTVESHIEALEELAPPSVLVDEHWNVEHLSESAGRYLQPRGGSPTQVIKDLVRPELLDELRSALHKAFEMRQPCLSSFVPVRFNGTPQLVGVLVQPRLRDAREQQVLVTFLEAGKAETDDTPVRNENTDSFVLSLRDKLRIAEQRLESMRQEHGMAYEDLRAANEELQSLNEEYRSTTEELAVQQVNSTVALERNHVYVIPPNANLDTIDTHLRLTELEERRNDRAPIDHFLRTLATTHDGTAIGVILTGAGTDGTLGLRHIKECGGLTIVQVPDEAEYDSMPRSAIASGMVDLVLPLRRIATEILHFCATQPEIPVPDGEDKIGPGDNTVLERILRELRKRTQQDFTVYRRSTLLRRVRRRMQLHHVTTFAGYLEVLTRELREADALAGDLLLTPSEFFGDWTTFLELEQRVIPDIFDRKATQTPGRVRAWTIGCSTGEEAYSLAMLLVEESEKRSSAAALQVFASDLSERMLGLAREGIYPREIATSVSPQRLERFFIPQPGFYRVKREIQDMVLFTSHNLFKHPPFGHIDLIVCRTLLSDLQPDVRRGVLALFHYALEPEGMLLLGPQDEVDTPELFDRQPGRALLFRRRRGAKHLPRLPDSMRPFGTAGAKEYRHAAPSPSTNAVVSLYCAAIEPYAPASVLINNTNEVMHFSSTAAKYLRIPGGELTHDLTRLVGDPLRGRLLEGLRRVRNGSQRWNSEPLSVSTDHGVRRLILRLEHVIATELILVVFEEHPLLVTDAEQPREAANTIRALQTELNELRDPQRRQALDAQSALDRPTSFDSQLEDAAADLQAALGDLASSREELQATNEELLALDDENRRRVLELTRISNDLQHLLTSTGIATLFLDQSLHIVRFTPELGTLFGLRPGDIGRPITDLARPLQYQNFEADVRCVLRSLQHIDREVRSTDERWYLARILPYRTEAGVVDGIVLTLLDITERKQAEQILNDSNRQKDEFLAMLAHELRNPLAPISSGVEVLKAAPGDRRLVERMAATMGRQTKQLVRLVDDLLEISRISGGKLHLRLGQVDIKDVIEDAVSSCKPGLDSAGHALEIEITEEPLLVEGDAARLTQILTNLLSNAVRYSPQRGFIAVRAARDNDEVVIAVQDQGIGISRESLSHVFDMFYQGRNARIGLGAGLGIGLTLAKTLVEMHRGSITAASAGENRGSEFTIRLPLRKSMPVPVPPAPREGQTTFAGDHRILIVDDNVDAAETLCMLMKSLGEREVHTASSGAAALAAAPEILPNIVLLDLMMPEMDGYEVARRIRSAPWGKSLRLVALSGWGHEEHRRRAKEAGFDQHVTKPADLGALQAMLDGLQPAV